MKTSKSGSAVRAVVVGLAAVMTLMLAASPADASIGSMSGTLRIDSYCSPGLLAVTVDGSVRMTRDEALGMIRTGSHQIRMEGWGDDWRDNREFGPSVIHNKSVGVNGLHFQWSSCVSKADLDEDPHDRDEIFVKLWLNQVGSGKQVQSGKTNTAKGDYS